MQKVIDKTTVLVYNIYVAISEDVTGYMQTYRSGHNGADSKTNALFGSSPLKNLDFMGFFGYH